MMKEFEVSGGSKELMSLATGQRPDGELIDSISQSAMNQKDAGGQSASVPQAQQDAQKRSSVMGYATGGLLGGGKGFGETMNGVKGGAQGLMKFVDDNPVLTEAIAMGASIAFPPAAVAIQGAKRGIEAANMVDNMTGGNLKGSGEGINREQAQHVAKEGRQMLQGNDSFKQVNQEWSQRAGMGLADKVQSTASALIQKQLGDKLSMR